MYKIIEVYADSDYLNTLVKEVMIPPEVWREVFAANYIFDGSSYEKCLKVALDILESDS